LQALFGKVIIKEVVVMKNFLFFASVFSLSINATIISEKDAHAIGMQIWKNEMNQNADLLVFWNKSEEFPSLGIGHFIWLPHGKQDTFTEGFPLLCKFFKNHTVSLPNWLEKELTRGAPWKNRAEFYQDKKRTSELRDLLSSTIDLQIHFMIQQLENQWKLILQSATKNQPEQLTNAYNLLRSSTLGTYALVDYLNFKGCGLNKAESLNGQQWGLLQVLLDMQKNLTSEQAPKAFALSAAKLLVQRISNSGPEYKLINFLNGWIQRISTYYDQTLDLFRYNKIHG
jgi:hypothetical protein